ncbi:MAG TPA: MFS transporter [Rugosimonospora sp.]|nr:MFS transporter [Rugosimonospora sp.]
MTSPATVTNTAPEVFRWRDSSVAQRNTLLAAFLGWMLNAFDVMLYSLMVTRLMSVFGMDQATAGLLNALTLAASAAGTVLFGLLADRFGRRQMLNYSIITYSVFTFACGLASSVVMLALLRFLVGVGMGGEWNCGAALVAETWPTRWRGRAMGIVLSGWAAGYALAAIVSGLILALADWRWVFFVGLLPALLTIWIRRKVPEPEIWKHSRERPVSSAEQKMLWRAARPRLLALLTMNTFGMFAWWGLFSWIPAYLALPQSQGGRNFQMLGVATLLIVLNLAGMFPGYLSFGVFADRFGRKRSVIFYLAAASLLVPFFAAAREPAAILVAGCMTAFFGTGFFAGSGTLGNELFPTPIRATALGLSYNLARGLSAAAPWVIGRLGETRGLSWAFLACGIAYGAAAITGLWVPETRGLELS